MTHIINCSLFLQVEETPLSWKYMMLELLSPRRREVSQWCMYVSLIRATYGSHQPWSDCFDKSHSTGMLLTHQASVADWCNKSHAMCYHVYVILHVKDPQLSVLRVRGCVQVAGCPV